nr:DNA repair protein RadC [Roseomonas gilardii]
MADGFSDAAGFLTRDPAPAPAPAPASRPVPAPGTSTAGTSTAGISVPGGPVPAARPESPVDLRRRLLNEGEAALSEEDMTALLLGFVLPADPRALAQAALRRFGSFAALLSASQRELRGVPGLGTHSIAALKLVQEAALRLARAEVMAVPVLDNWDRLLAYLTASLARERIEQFRVLFLDAEERLLADEAQARGTVNHTPVYPREVVKRALELDAARLILVHNHPSGDPTPSRDDLLMTERVRQAAECLGIVLQDHVIVGNGRHTSFRREGLL